MSSLIEIQSQIDRLQKQANEIKAKDFAATVQEIVAKMQAFGITVKDLQNLKLSKAGRSARRALKVPSVKLTKEAKKVRTPVAPKYRGPNGEAWSGRGLTPRWLSTLIAQGQSKDSFAINA
jgi:DNA-binding protein H-NS